MGSWAVAKLRLGSRDSVSRLASYLRIEERELGPEGGTDAGLPHCLLLAAPAERVAKVVEA